MEQSTKVCRKCGAEKLFSEYYNKSNKCKTCFKAEIKIQKQGYVPLFEREVNSRLKNLCTKAKLRTKEFLLCTEDLISLYAKQSGLCAYTKLPLVPQANQFNTLSLDRIDSGKGYVVTNVQLVCAAVNKMKQEYDENLFIYLCKCVAQNCNSSAYPTDSALIEEVL